MITRLLLVDSDISFIVTLKQALESTGNYRVNLAANGQAAHEALLHSAYHAALVDFEPVDMDPLELVRMIHQVRPDLPVIMMPRDEAEMARAHAMDVQGAIPKPFTARELIAYLGEVIGRVEGPVITPPEGEVEDEFVPPAMPAVALPQERPSEPPSPETPEVRPPTRLFSPEERDFIRQGLQDLDERDEAPAAFDEPEPPPVAADMSELLAEFEVFDRLQTGQLGRIQEDAGDWETIPPLAPPVEQEVETWPPASQDEEAAPPDEAPSLDLPTTWLLEGQPDEEGATRLLGDEEELPPTLLLDEQGMPAEQGAPPLEWRGDLPTTWLLESQPEEEGATRLLGDEEELPTTLLLDEQESEPPPTRVLDEEQEPEPTRRLPDTGTLEKLLSGNVWEGAGTGVAEPPVQHDDTPTVPPHDLEAVRQFLATHSDEADASEFGDVLDAVAQTSPEDYERSPDDRAFHDLVESLRTPDMTLQRRTRLEELLASIAADSGHAEPLADSEAAIDYVLDAIRQSGAAPESAGTTPDDTTIADVIDGLFEPSFEDVLAALAGEEVDDRDYEEPSYSRPVDTRTRPDPTDVVSPDDMAAEEAPAWLAEVEPVEDRQAQPEAPATPEQFVEPPLTEEDSRHYPATTALAAVSGAEAGDDFSLSQLLAEIEEQLPPVLPRQPRLKPLPSWGKGTRLADARDLEAIFDQLQGAAPATPETRPTSRPAADEAEPERFDSTAIFQEPGGYETGLPEELRELASYAPDDQADITAIFYDGVRAEAWEFAEVGEEAVGTPAAEEFAWEEPAEAEPEWQELATEAPAPHKADVYAAEPSPAEEAVAQPETEPPPVMETMMEWAEETERGTIAPDVEWEREVEQEAVAPPPMPGDERLVAVPVEEAARLLQGEAAPADSAEDIDIAQMAVELTQYSLESSAQATMLSRPGRLLAHAGELPPAAIQRAFEILDAAWHKKPPHLDSIFRYITLPEVGEALLYAVAVEGDMALSLIFAARTSLHTIRRQARRLGESLNLIPELPQPEEPPAARTRPRRPQPPAPEPAAAEVAPAEVAVAEAPPATPPMVGYTCLWIPHDPRLELRGEFAHELMGWLEEITRQEGWQVQALAIHTDYVQMSLEVPQNLQPDQVLARLMADTAERSAVEFPDLAFGQPLWADGYYLVTPPRELSDREIARFITFQRQS